ncbi:MAG: 3-phosphoshikimate 1-carboxyvinyltransferase [Muribaculaceae bacterium]
MNIKLLPPDGILETTVELPLSKSVSARALVINALTEPPAVIRPEDIAQCDDISALILALGSDHGHVSVGASATAMRLLTAYYAARRGSDVVISGSEGLLARPVGILVDALRAMGADISYQGAEGYPPLAIKGKDLSGGSITIEASESSQYVSALMLIAPLLSETLQITLAGETVSMPYIRMTAQMMERCGVSVAIERDVITIEPMAYRPPSTPLRERDWSAAAFWYEIAAVTAGWVTLSDMHPKAMQGDAVIAEIFPRLGVLTEWSDEGAELSATPDLYSRLDLDVSDMPDTVPAMVATCCLIGVPFRLKGAGRLRIKECDRVAALISEMAKIGCPLTMEGGDTLVWEGTRLPITEMPVFDSHGDHRIAMALAAVSCFVPGIVIKGAEAVSKSYPSFWADMQEAGFTIMDADSPEENDATTEEEAAPA